MPSAWWRATGLRVIAWETLIAKALLHLIWNGLSVFRQSAKNLKKVVNYYLYLNSEQAGPFSEAEIVSMVAAGQVSATDFVWRDGMADWLPIEAVITLGAPPVPTFPPNQAQKFQSPKPKELAAVPKRSVAKKYFVFAGVLALLALALYLISPFLAVHRLRLAAEAQDAIYVTDNVDFPKLRESLKGALSAQMAKEATSTKDDGLGALGAAFGAMMVGPLVDALVTPEAVIGLMQGKDIDAISGQAAGVSSSSDPSTTQDAKENVSTSMGYEGLNRFVVSAANNENKTASLVFLRDGLFSWKLAGVRLQAD